MKIDFEYEEDSLTVKTDQHSVLRVWFTTEDPDADPNYITYCGEEWVVKDDMLNSLFVSINNQYYSLYQVVIEAGSQWRDIVEEAEREAEMYRQDRAWLSSVEKTGRI